MHFFHIRFTREILLIGLNLKTSWRE